MDVLNKVGTNFKFHSQWMHLHVFSRFYKRKQIADFLFASLDYKALPICLTLKKKDFAPKGSSLYLKS